MFALHENIGSPPTRSSVSQEDSSRSAVDITRLLQDWQGGDHQALDRLLPLVYDELHIIAGRHLARERPERTLQTTALVNEAYMKLVDQRKVDWQNRAHFFALAARLMRRIVLDDARRRRREKRGGNAQQVPIEDMQIAAPAAGMDAVDALELDRALTQLETLDADQGRIVELRYYGGLTVEETAAVMGVSAATIKREWAMAKGWLFRALTTGAAPASTA
jgi:RNA polymerase sigma-70 factor (ECF subfamily)